jgi:hypothetical protein
MPNTHSPSKKSMLLLSRLLLSSSPSSASTNRTGLLDLEIANIGEQDFDLLVALANSNHVIVRGMEIFAAMMEARGDQVRANWANEALATERARIQNAIPFLHSICAALEEEGHDATVIKSLDHWPDLGSDLDLYTNAASAKVIDLMERRFKATLASRSWGDRLAHKWNFLIPGLPEAVEIHVGRLGQTGEQMVLASSVARRARQVEVGGYTFRVPAISDRLMISALQRMYRHFYFRLQRAAAAAGIWEGMATYLVIVSDYVNLYRGTGFALPESVTATARFGGEKVYYAREFLRVPILPNSASLYGSQITGLLRRRELESSVRLGLLPWLATAAAVGQKITGSDKGIW